MSDALHNTVIWGTTVVVNDAYNMFKDFIEHYEDPTSRQLFFPPVFERVRQPRRRGRAG